jgi:hypothetical protein
MEIESIRLASKLCESTAIAITDNLAAHLIIEVDGNDKDVLMKDMEAIADVLSNFEVGELYFADDAQQKTELWKIRRKANEASVAAGYTIEEDTVVPRAELPKLIKGVKALAAENGFKVVSYGHAGDGNLHIRINHPLYKKSYENEVIQGILIKIFELVKSLGGTISGEHGIGLIQKSFMPVVFDPVTMELMNGIKIVFDQNHILKAFKKLLDEVNFSISLVLVMQILDKKYFKEVKNYVQDNFKDNKIIILSNLKKEQLVNLYKNSKAYVFSSYCEVFGLTTLEAMHYKVPVVVSNRSALPEINSNAALYFDPDNVFQIKNALKKSLLNKNVGDKLIKKGTKNLKRFILKKSIKHTYRIIEELH